MGTPHLHSQGPSGALPLSRCPLGGAHICKSPLVFRGQLRGSEIPGGVGGPCLKGSLAVPKGRALLSAPLCSIGEKTGPVSKSPEPQRRAWLTKGLSPGYLAADSSHPLACCCNLGTVPPLTPCQEPKGNLCGEEALRDGVRKHSGGQGPRDSESIRERCIECACEGCSGDNAAVKHWGDSYWESA